MRLPPASLSLGAAVLVSALVLAPAAQPRVEYPAAQTLSESGQDASFPRVAVDAQGRVTVVWERSDGAKRRVQAVRLGADGVRGTVQTLSEAGQDAVVPQVTVDAQDRATVVWLRFDGARLRVQTVRLAADGSPQAPQTLSEAGQDADVPQVAVDAQGSATVVWRRSDGANSRVQAVRLGADGTMGAPQTLSEAGQSAQFPQLAVDAQGRATVVWYRSDGANSRVQAVRLAADGAPGAVQTLSEAGQNAFFPQVSVDAQDRVTVVWQRSDGANLRVQAVRLAADGVPGALHTLSEPGQSAIAPQVAVDAQGRATVVWQRSDGAKWRVQSVRLGADGAPGAVRTLSESGQDAFGPQLAVDGQGRATVVWYRSDGAKFRVQAVRLAADGSPGAPQTLSEAGQAASSPRVAVDAQARATVVWYRSDGAKLRVQAVRATIVAPETRIDSGPGEGQRVAAVSPSFAFSGAPAAEVARFECRLDAGEFAACTSPVRAGPLAAGRHTFAVRAVDPEGDADASPAERSFTVLARFGARTQVTLVLAAPRIPAGGPLTVRVANANLFPVSGRLAGQTLRGRTPLKATAFRVGARGKATVKLALPLAARSQLLRDGKLSLRLTAKLKDPAGTSRTVTKTLTVRLRRG